MADEEIKIRFSDLKDDHPLSIDGTYDLIALSKKSQGSSSGYTQLTTTPNQLGSYIVEEQTFANLTTTAKTPEGAINEIVGDIGTINETIEDLDNRENIITEITTQASTQTFTDGGDNAVLVELVAEVGCNQSGTGDPSPTNVRPITGYSEITVTVSDGDQITNTHKIDLGREVFGGEVKIADGTCTITITKVKAKVSDFTDWDANIQSSRYEYYANDSHAPTSDFEDIISDSYKTSDSVLDDVCIEINFNGHILIADSTHPTLSDFTTDMANAEIVYPLVTPIVVTVPCMRIPTLSGTNVISVDSGDIKSLKYYNDNIGNVANLIADMSGKQIDLYKTLTVGSTSLTFQDSSITTDSTIDIYTDTYGVNPSDVVVTTGQIVLTFPAQQADLGVKVRVL